MLRYPLGGRAHIYINNHDLSEFCAKLATDYSISGYELTNTYHQGPDRSSFALLRQTHGLLSIVLPLDFYGRSKPDTMEKMAEFAAECSGQVEIDLSDGFAYTCVLSEIGDTAWSNDELCSVDYSFVGIKHKPPVQFTGGSPITIYNAATWPQNDCRITVKNFAVTSDTPVVVALSSGGTTYLTWNIDTSGGLYTGGDLILDGIQKRNLYHSGNIPTNTMTWTDYPYLQPGENTISVSLSSADLELYYVPAYL